MSCKMKIAPSEKIHLPENADAGKVQDSQLKVICGNASASDQPQNESVDNGSREILVGSLLLLNAVQLAVIIFLVVIFRGKLAMQNQSAKDEAKEQIEMNASEYVFPRTFPKAPEPCNSDENEEYMVLEDAGVYLQQAKEPAVVYPSHNYAMNTKTKTPSSDTVYSSKSGGMDRSSSSNEVRYYSYE